MYVRVRDFTIHPLDVYARGNHVTKNITKIPTKRNVILTLCACMLHFHVYARGNNVTKNVTKMPTKRNVILTWCATWV